MELNDILLKLACSVFEFTIIMFFVRKLNKDAEKRSGGDK